MILAFTLTMPGVNSWNGRWTGEDRLHVHVRTLTGKAAETAMRHNGKCYSYAWSDGWRASISVRQVAAPEATKLRKRTKGFCGYEWMIDSILRDGGIYATPEEKAAHDEAVEKRLRERGAEQAAKGLSR